jgi:septal ring factor EnvC (AmiA/AmiB activator)
MAGRFSSVLIVFAAVVLSAQTPEQDQAHVQSARAAARIRVLQKEADRLAAEARTVFGDLRKLELQRQIKREEVTAADYQLKEVTAARDAAAARLSDLEARRVAESPGVSARLIELSKRGRGGYVQLLLATSDIKAFGRMSRGVAAVAELDRVRLEAHRKTVAAERAAVAEIDQRRDQVAAVQKSVTRARAALDTAVAARNRLIEDLDSRRDLAAQYVTELETAQREIERTIDAVPTGHVATLPFRPFRGDLDWPLTGPVLTRFGRSAEGRFGTAIVRNGIEIAGTEGAPVTAIHEGTVAFAAPFAGFGVMVIVDHGDEAFSLYGQLADTLLSQGSVIRRGDIVGSAGLVSTGEAGVYFELRIDGRPVDPLQWLRRSR